MPYPISKLYRRVKRQTYSHLLVNALASVSPLAHSASPELFCLFVLRQTICVTFKRTRDWARR